MNVDLKKIGTEQRNPNTMNIDVLSTIEIIKKINDEDKKVAYAVEAVLEDIAPLVDKIEVVRKGKVRRAKLNYIRKLSAKAARIKERR